MLQNTVDPDGLFDKAIRRGLFPGAALTVAKGKEVVFEAAWGRVTYVPWSARVGPETVYDLASLTKPLATALSVVALIEKGDLYLDDTIGKLLSRVPLDKDRISIRHLLSHTSGLPAYRAFYKNLIRLSPDQRDREMKRLLLAEPFESPCRTKAKYSDLGFMILGWVIENLTGKDLADAAKALVFEPLEVEGLQYVHIPPPVRNPSTLFTIAPSEACPLRKRVVWGEVHDLNAWVMGGVAGHAGLFGTAGSVAKVLLKLLDVYNGRSKIPSFSQGLLREFWQIHGIDPQSSWALGFDTPSPAGSSAGSRFPPKSIGHLGFTGTSFWMDLVDNVLIVLLTNRTFPKADKEGQAEMFKFRAELHDMVREIW